MEMLELRDLHKTFNPGTVNEKVALNGVSLTMEAGDFATIVGSNGAGKSTLFNAITGGFIADEGSITLGGEDITFAPEYQRSRVIGHLFQDPLKGTAPNMTIEENLALAYLRAGTVCFWTSTPPLSTPPPPKRCWTSPRTSWPKRRSPA